MAFNGSDDLELDAQLQLEVGSDTLDTIQRIEKSLDKVADRFEQKFDNAINKISTNMGVLGEGLSSILQMQTKDIVNGINNISKSTATASSSVLKYAKGVGVAIGIVTAGLKASFKVVGDLTNLMITTAKKAVTYLKSAFSSLVSGYKNIISYSGTMVKNVVTTFAKVSTSIGEATLKLSGFTTILKGIKTGLTSIAETISGVFGSMSFGDLLKEASALSSELAEVQNRVDVVFGDSADIINKFAENAIDKLGMTTTAAKDFASSFGAALKSTGQSTENIKNMSLALTELSADAASFFDKSQEWAKEKLFSGVISGQIRPMRELGVEMTKASLDAYTTAKGYSTLYSKMDATSKQAVRFEYVMEKLNYVHGDYQRTINSTANQIRLLKNQLKELGTVVGAIINTVIAPVIRAMNTLVNAITRVAKAVASLLNIDWRVGIGAGSDYTSNLADLYGDTADEADDLAEAQDNVAKSTKKAAKEAKNALAPFHKLNVLQNKQQTDLEDLSSTNTPLGNLGKLGGAYANIGKDVGTGIESLKDLMNKFEKWLTNKIQEWNKWLKAAPQKIKDFFNKLQKYIKWGADMVNKFIKEIDWVNFGRTIRETLAGVGKSLYTWFKERDFKDSGRAFGDFMKGLLETPDAFVQWGKAIGAAIQDAFDWIVGAAQNIPWKNLGYDLWAGLRAALAEIEPKTIYEAIKSTLSGVGTAFIEFFNNLSRDETTKKKIADIILSLINGVADYIGSSDFEKLVGQIVDYLDDLLGRLNEGLEKNGTASKIAQGVATVFAEGMRLITGDNFLTFVATIWGTLANTIKQSVSKIREKGTDKKIRDALVGIFESAWSMAEDLIFFIFDVDSWDGVFDKVLGKIEEFWGLLKEAVLKHFGVKNTDELGTKVSESLEKMWDSVVKHFDKNANGSIWDELADKIWTLAKEAIDNVFLNKEIPFAIRIGLAEQLPLSGLTKTILEAYMTIHELWERLKQDFEFIGWFCTTAVPEALTTLATFIWEKLKGINDTVQEFNANIPEKIAEVWENIKVAATEKWEEIKVAVGEKINELKEDIGLKIEDIKGVWSSIVEWFDAEIIQQLWGIIQPFVEEAQAFLTDPITYIEETWQAIVDWFNTTIIEPVTGFFEELGQNIQQFLEEPASVIEDAWNSVERTFNSVCSAIDSFLRPIKDTIQSIIDKVQELISSLSNSTIGKWAGGLFSGGLFSSSGSLFNRGAAGGAIIQPNKPQMLLVGDQRSGVNIESPLSTIETAFRNVISEAGSLGFSGDIVIPVYVDGVIQDTKIIKAVQLHNYRSNGR